MYNLVPFEFNFFLTQTFERKSKDTNEFAHLLCKGLWFC
jgi:hypothetical protein